MRRLVYFSLILAALLVACNPCPPCTPCPTETPGPTPTATPPAPIHPVVEWEPFLDEINARVDFVEGARYQLVAVWHTSDGQWDTAPEYAMPYITVNGGGAETHAFAIVYQKDGTPLVGKSVLLTWPGGEDGRTTWDDGSVNFFTPAKYYPDQGATGPYCVEVLKGDRYCGAGLPYGLHVSLFGVWREDPNYSPTLMQRFRAFITGRSE